MSETFDFGDWCSLDVEDVDEFSNSGTCKHCGACVDFINTGVRWRVYEVGANKRHVCNKTASPDEFEDMT